MSKECDMVERRPLTPDDFWQLRHITDMRISPDGIYLAYVVESSEREENERRAAIYLMDTQTGISERFTSGTARDTSPRWSPDSARLAFLSTRDGKEPQVYVLPVDGGEARQVTRLRRGASEPFWSADGTWIGCSSEVRAGESPTEAPPKDAAARERQERDEAERPRIYSQLVYRWDGKGYFDGRIKLFRVTLANGRVEPLTDGDYDDSEPACSPDGRWLAFISDRGAHRDENMATDLWLLDLRTGETRRLTDGHAVVIRPAWSPDGTRLAFFSSREVGERSVYNNRLLVAEVESGTLTDLFGARDLSAEVQLTSDLPTPSTSAPVWSADGRAVSCLAQRGGGVDVLRVSVAAKADGEVETVVAEPQAVLKQIALAGGDAALFALRCDAMRSFDLWRYPLEGAERDEAPTALTDLNRDVLAGAMMTAPENVRFTAADGWELEAWLYRPARRRAPLVLTIHGGPHGAYGAGFSFLTQILTGRGYAVLLVNPRGSAGYGEPFMQACDRDWGGADCGDLLAGIEAALARGGLDGERLAVTGVSYGGYMTNWLLTQTDRFRAAVSVYGIANLTSMFGTADMDPVWAEGDYGWPWENQAFYRERSPITFADRVRTPLRILAAEQDYRCPIAQAQEWFTWLKRRGSAPVELVRLPRASHTSFASPRQRIQRLELTLEWIERYCPAR
jgi:dipeptidyl aminopeptidase/acylaminoacyl peptidase